MKNSFILILVLALALSLDAFGQRIPVGRLKDMVPTRESKPEVTKKGPTPLAEFATIYPGAVPVNPNYSDGRGKQYGSFYTDDPFEKVWDYYIREVGNPTTDNSGLEYFRYKDYDGDWDYVYIYTNGRQGSTSDGIISALYELKQITYNGLLSDEDYQKLKDKYYWIVGYWRNDFCVEIFNKHKDRLDYSIIYDNMFAESQRLGLAGKRDEAIAFLEQERKKWQELMELNNSPRIVDEWIKCLDEIVEAAKDKKNYWNVKISISRTGKG